MSDSDQHPAPPEDMATVLREAMRQRTVLLAQGFATCRDWALAEDALQEALIIAAERWQQLRSIDGVLPWMRQILRLKCLELLRRERQQKSVLVDERMALAIQYACEGQPDEEQGAGRLKAMKAALHHCMQGLNSEHRQLLHAFYWQRQSCEDLAQSFARRPDNLRAILSRLRKRLMACVERRLNTSEEGYS